MAEIAAVTFLRRPRRARGGSLLLWSFAAILLVCQTLIWYQPRRPALAVLDQFALQLALLALLAAVVALVLRRWLCLVALIGVTATLSWPIFTYRDNAAFVIHDPARLKILSANLWHSAPGHERTIETLLASDADIIGLVEVTPEWRPAIAPLIAKYPYRVDCFAAVPECQAILLSKLPIVRPYAGRLWKATPIVAGGELLWNGRPITVLATHWFRPVKRSDQSLWGEYDRKHAAYLANDLPLSRQAGQAGLLAKYVDRLPRDVILMGDFNSVPWSRIQRLFRAKTGLDNAAGWQFTWPSSLPPPLRLPIDHVLARGHLVVTKFETGPRTDSDHLPVVAEIGWRD